VVVEPVHFYLVDGLSVGSVSWSSSIVIRSTEKDVDSRRFLSSVPSSASDTFSAGIMVMSATRVKFFQRFGAAYSVLRRFPFTAAWRTLS